LVVHSTIALVDEDLDIFKAIKRGWEVVSKNIWPMLVTMLIVVLISFAAVIGSLIPLGLASLPWIITLATGGVISTVGWIGGGIVVGLAVLMICFIAMWVNTLVHGIFVVMFRRLKANHTANVPTSFIPVTPIAPVPVVQSQNEQAKEDTQDAPYA